MTINSESTIISSDNKINSEILSALKLLWNTPVGTVALDRDFGIDMSFVDMPINKAKQMFTVEIIKKTQKYEPRIAIESISFSSDVKTGKLVPTVKIGEA